MKQCLECQTTKAKTWKGQYCARCSSRRYRALHPNYQKDYDKRRGNGSVRRAYAKQWRQNNPEKSRKHRRDSRLRDAETTKKRDAHFHRTPESRFSNAKLRAKKRDLIWNITFDEFKTLIQQPCHYCQNKLGKAVEVGVGLDRIDNNRGYELTNVVSCCWPCNILHSNILTADETMQVVKFILTLRGLSQSS